MLRKRRGRLSHTAPEITLTPLIDTALTLLVIFMVTTPMINNSIKIDVPTSKVGEKNKVQQDIIVSVDADGKIFFNATPVTIESLGPTLTTHLAQVGADKKIWIKIDGKRDCQALINVMASVNKAGGRHVSVVTKSA